MNYFIKFVFIVSTLSFWFSAQAQQPLTLDEALQFVKLNNLQLLQQQDNQRLADLETKIMHARRLPALDLSFNSVYLSEVNEIDIGKVVPLVEQKLSLGGHDRLELQAGIKQPVFTGFKLKSAENLAKKAALGEQAKLAVATNEIYHKVYILYYSAQSLANQKAILAASSKRLRNQLETARNLFEAAQVMAFDTLQVYNQILVLRIEEARLQRAQKLLGLQVARLLDLPKTRPFAVEKPAVPTPLGKSLAELKVAALQIRPELEGVRLAQRINLLQQKMARADFFPAFFAQGTFHYAKPGLDPVNNRWMHYFSIGLNAQWNLWRWQADVNKVEQLKVQANSLTLQQRELVRSIEYEVSESFENLTFSRRQLQLAEELQAQQQERYRIVSIQHQNGVAATNELITAETDLTRAQLQKHQALVQYHIYLADLRRATGSIAANQGAFTAGEEK